jgi:hypothetical protein
MYTYAYQVLKQYMQSQITDLQEVDLYLGQDQQRSGKNQR